MDVEDFDVPITEISLNDAFCYPKEQCRPRTPPAEISRACVTLHRALGFPASSRGTYCLLGTSTLCYLAGAHVVLLNYTTGEQQILRSPRCGLTSVAAHPSGSYFAIGEKHYNGANIYIYTFPSLQLHRVLRGAANIEVALLAFSNAEKTASSTEKRKPKDPSSLPVSTSEYSIESTVLLSVSGAPDYTLCVWEWKSERLLLRARAFAADVFAASFCPAQPSALVTSGPAHIKFWHIADTFTGLKLQGALGRFGAVELADIPCFVHVPQSSYSSGPALVSDNSAAKVEVDAASKTPSAKTTARGKLSDSEDNHARGGSQSAQSMRVLAATDSGPMLLWERGKILRTVPVESPVKACYSLPESPFTLVAACADGHVRIYNMVALGHPDPSQIGHGPLPEVFRKIPVPGNCPLSGVISLPPANPTESDPTALAKCLAVDGAGNLWEIGLATGNLRSVGSLHATPVASISAAPQTHIFAVVGQGDNILKFYDATTSVVLARHKLPASPIYVKHLPLRIDTLGVSVVVGFSDGSFRFYSHAPGVPNLNSSGSTSNVEVKLTHAFFPYREPIVAIEFADDPMQHFIVASKLGSLFIFKVARKNSEDDAVDDDDQHIFDAGVQITPVGRINLGIPISSFRLCHGGADVRLWAPRFLVLSPSAGLYGLDISLRSLSKTNYAIQSSNWKLTPWVLANYLPQKLECDRENDNKEGTNVGAHQGGGGKGKNSRFVSSATNIVTSGDQTEEDNAKDESAKVTWKFSFAEPVPNDMLVAVIERSDDVSEVRILSLENQSSSLLLMKFKSKVTSFCASVSNVLVGTQKGCVYTIPLLPSYLVSSNTKQKGHSNSIARREEAYWKDSVHVNECTALVLTFDGAYYISGGADCALMVFRCHMRRLESPHYLMAPRPIKAGTDLRVPYVIEEYEQVSAKEKETIAALSRKEITKERVEKLKSQFNSLCSAFATLPTNLKLSPQLLQVDPDLEEHYKQVVAKNIEEIKKRTLWQSTSTKVLHDRVRERFTKRVLSDVEYVSSYRNEFKVTTFRTERLPVLPGSTKANFSDVLGEQKQSLASLIVPQLRDHPGRQFVSKKALIGGAASYDSKSSTLQPGPETNQFREEKHQHEESRASAVSRMEEKIRQRQERMEEFQAILAAKPNADSEDPRDTFAIQEAERNIGDKKLKTDTDYIVPENELLNAEIKLRQLYCAKHSLVAIMEAYNDKVRHVKKERESLLEKIRERNAEIKRNLSWLWSSAVKLVYDEENFTVSLAMLDEHKEKLTISKAAGDNESQDITDDVNISDNFSLAESMALSKNTVLKQRLTEHGVCRDALNCKILEKQAKILAKENENDVIAFDENLKELYSERLSVAFDIKIGEITLILLYKEWKLLKDFEKHDMVLNEKLENKLNERMDIDSRIAEMQRKVDEKRRDVEQAVARKKEIETQAKHILSDTGMFEDHLTKMYRKKCKNRRRGASNSEGDDDDNDDMDGSIDLDSSDSDEDGADEAVSDDCPRGCNPSVFANILKLRKERDDNENHLVELQKSFEALRKDFEAMGKREKTILASLKQTEQEIRDFQCQKQMKLNEIYAVVPMYNHQILYSENDVKEALLFPANGTRLLERRIQETKMKTEHVRIEHRNLRLQHISQLASRKEKRQLLREAEKKYVEVQRLKFGREVDIEKLERVETNKNLEELRKQLSEKERCYEKMALAKERGYRKLQEDYRKCVAAHTTLLRKQHQIWKTRESMAGALEANMNRVASDFGSHSEGQEVDNMLAALYAKYNERQKIIRSLRQQLHEITSKKHPQNSQLSANASAKE